MADINLNGWVKARRGVLSHLQDGRMPPNEFVVFHILLYLADKATGSGKINSTAIEFWTADQLSKDSANRALVGLEKKNYIVREIVPGKVGLYVFHVQKYVPTVGADEGKQLLFTKNSSGVEKIAELLNFFGAEDASEAPSEAASGTPSDPQSDLTSDRADDTRRENREPKKGEVRNSVVGVGEPGEPQLPPVTKEPSGDNHTPIHCCLYSSLPERTTGPTGRLLERRLG